ncbi:heptosyltransferase [Bacteriovorax sp. DB6_IX]|nr:heptosyltransferase [Bacteriovorax sp. DB6_IX]
MNLLFVKIGAIGDVIMALSCLNDLKKSDPDIRITWVVGKIAEPFVKSVNLVDEYIVIDDRKLLKGSLVQKVSVLFDIWIKLGFKKFNKICIGHTDKRYKIIVPFFFCKKIDLFYPLKNIHHSTQYLKLLADKDISLEETVEFNIESSKNFKLPSDYIVLSPGGASNLLRDDNLRRWPIKNYVELAKKLLDLNRNVVIVGGPGDTWVTEYFDGLNVYNLVAETTLGDLYNICRGSKVTITHDSGQLHIANAAESRVIALFGPTEPSEKVLFRNSESLYLWRGNKLQCSPCYDGKNYSSTCEENICLKDISPDEVFSLI